MKITDKTNNAIRERAYHIWESAGRPDGRADEHWQQAMHDVISAPPMTTPEKPKAAKKSPAKKAATVLKDTPAKATTMAKKAAAETRKAPAKKKAPAK